MPDRFTATRVHRAMEPPCGFELRLALSVCLAAGGCGRELEGAAGEPSVSPDSPAALTTEVEPTAVDGPAKVACEPELSESPSAFFGETMLIRFPVGIEARSMAQTHPRTYRLTGPVASVLCPENTTSAVITDAAVGWIRDDRRRPMAEYAAEALDGLGYAGGTLSDVDVDEKERSYRAVVLAPLPFGDREGTARLQMRSDSGRVYYVLFQADADDWPALSDTFKASATKMVFLQP